MRRSLLCLLIVAACAGRKPAPEPAPATATAPRRPLQVLADSTAQLVTYAAGASDTAGVNAQFALADSLLDRVRSLVVTARVSARSAREHAAAAMAQGDRIHTFVTSGLFEEERARSYDRYWKLGRAKLDTARTRSQAAVQAADSALLCDAGVCVTTQALQIRTHMVAASGAAREAESLVRIALRFVR